ncbi:MAG: sulfur carrier protein ThiS [Muribaculaceae bacterium]
MKVSINKQDYEIADGTTLLAALKQVPNIPEKGVAVAVNNAVVSSTKWSETTLNENDKITVIKAFYGG